MEKWLSNAIDNGEKRGEVNAIYKIIKKGGLSIEETANAIGMSVEQLLASFKEYNLVL